jgi:hypothetical protein
VRRAFTRKICSQNQSNHKGEEKEEGIGHMRRLDENRIPPIIINLEMEGERRKGGLGCKL